MTFDNTIEIFRLIIDFLEIIIPYGLLAGLIYYFRKELIVILKDGRLKISAPGFSFESLKQQEEISKNDQKEINALNSELKNLKNIEKKLTELQDYTARGREIFFLGYYFEKTYRVIFPSQMVILNILNNSSDMELSEDIAQSLFRRTIWAIKYNVTYEQFIGFLVESGLIFYESVNKKYKLAPLGKIFWEYLKSNNIHLKIPANDAVETVGVY